MNTQADKHPKSWRRLAYVNLHTEAWHKHGLSPVNKIIVFLICLGVGVAIIESEPTVFVGNEMLFRGIEIAFALVFLAEYVARLWSAAESPAYAGGWRGRLRYAFTFASIIDLIALVSLFMTLFGTEGAVLRLVRLFRIVMLARLGRYSTALNAIWFAVHSRRYELLMSLAVAAMLMLISSTLLYIVEGPVQPDQFGSIPRAMWWSIATLTTVGYGDVYPLTPLGKILAGLTAVTGIGLIAMPTGILAGAFGEAIRNQQEAKRKAKERREENPR